MGKYKGYQVNINGLSLPFPPGLNVNIIEPNSYSAKKEERVLGEWIDANGKTHRQCGQDEQTTISFTIKEHTQEQHERLEPLFRSTENILVEYWDDSINDYKTGRFFINDVEAVSSIATRETIYYDKLNFVLVEY